MRDADVFYAIVGNTGGARGTASPRCAADGQTPASGASPQPSAATKGEPKGADRRRSFRHPTGTVGVLTPFGAGPGAPELQVFVVNVSIHGAGFRCPVSFDLGAKYDMRIGNGPLFLSSRVRIISSRRRKDGTFDVGAEFF